jgi:colanic acid biosynthesis glycosyl transferase WcaI
VDRILLELSFVSISLIQALVGWRPDIILYTIPSLPVSVPATLLSWLWRCPLVLNLQDILPEAAIHVGLLHNRKLIWIFEKLERFAYHTATKITVITDKFTENLVEQKGVKSTKIARIPNWVDISTIHPLPKHNRFRKKHGITDQFLVLYSGNIALTQPLEIVIKAAVYLQDQFPQILFVIVGEEKALERLHDLQVAIGANSVKLLPFEPVDMLPEMLAAADVSLVLQRRNVVAFNMPSKIQKILASGRPIVASVPDSGSAAQVVRQSQGGLVVESEKSPALAEAVLQLYHDPEMAATMGRNGREFAINHYSYQTALQSYENLFQELVGGSVGSGPSQAQATEILERQAKEPSPMAQCLNFVLSRLGLDNVG